METHGIKPGCCTAMDNFISLQILQPDEDGTVSMDVLHQPGALDTPIEVTRVTVRYCPNCGKPVGCYTQASPAPTISRATVAKGACNDSSCRFCVSEKCAFAFRNTGCYRVDAAAINAVNTARAELIDAENAKLFVSVST